MIGPLTRPQAHGGEAADPFHVVIPSVPGFAFSSPVSDAGWGSERVAAAWAELMRRLGYERYGTQGGDLGAGIATAVGRHSPSNVLGVHTNGSLGAPLHNPEGEELASLTPLEQDRVARVQAFMNEEFGYIAIQGTRPQLIGAALSDSPLAQLAWIVDKFQAWTHPRAALPDDVISRDRLLTNVMLYWLTVTGGSSAYIGYAQTTAWGEPKQPSGVPTASIQFAHDVGIRRYAEIEDRITRWTDIEGRGGHFAALEEPELLVRDIREFFAGLKQTELGRTERKQTELAQPSAAH